MNGTSLLFEARNLAVRAGPHRICEGLNLRLKPGDTLALIGRNGAGKSTLLQALAGLHPQALMQGELILKGVPLERHTARERARIRGFCPQRPHEPFASHVLETVLLGRHPHLGRFDTESEHDHRLAMAALARVEMAEKAAYPLSRLSGGERQRVAIAALLAQSPRVYFLDEPLAHLDLHHQVATLALFSEEAAKGNAIVMVIHDINLVGRFASDVLLLDGNGGYLLGPTQAIVTVETLSRAFGHPMRAIPDRDRLFFVADGNP
jgi:iron complex transport system ATP-binding protein